MEQLSKVRRNRLDLSKKRRTLPVRRPLEAPDNLYKSYPQCKESILFEGPMHNLYACLHYGHHMELTARERLCQIADKNSFTELDQRPFLRKEQFAFPSCEKKLSHLQKEISLQEAVVYGTVSIGDFPCATIVIDSNFLMGSMEQIVGEGITHYIEYAMRKKLPLLIFMVSGRTRIQERTLSLVQMAKTNATLAKHSDAGLLYISYLTHPTTGGVNASFAMPGDIILSEPGCLIGFVGKHTIASTVKKELPASFQKAEFLLEKSFVDAIMGRKDSRGTLRRILKLHERRTSWT